MLKVDIGCGDRKPPGYVGVDICAGPEVDIVADISKIFPFHDGTVDELRAYDVIEHLPDRINTMNEIWRVCRAGAKVELLVPSSDGRGAFQDPTHVSFWNINSFRYYSIEFPGYYNLCRKYGFKGAFRILRLQNEDSGDGVIHVRAELQVVKPVPELEQPQLTTNYIENAPLVSEQANIQLTSIEPKELINLLLHTELEIAIPLLSKVTTQIDEQQLAQYCQTEDQDAQNRLLQLRYVLAKQLLSVSGDRLELWYSSVLGKVHRQLVWSSIKLLHPTPEDATLAAQALTHLGNDQQADKQLQNLLVVMLYFQSHQVPTQIELTELPPSIIQDYLRYIFRSPYLFQELGEAEQYYYHLNLWVDYLHQSIFSNADSPFWREVADYFFNHFSFLHLYFNEFNLKEICQKRAEIFEYNLERLGYQLDYEFPERVKTRKKIRLGILANHFLPSAETHASLAVYEHLSRDFEVILYSLNQTDNPLEVYCRSSANGFRRLPEDLEAQVQTMRADDLDVLWIGTNITAYASSICRLILHRLARVQVSSVASVVTSGFRHVDYYISGTTTDSSIDADQHYSEKLIRIKGTAQCFSYPFASHRSELRVTRVDLDIATESVVFVSAANLYKLLPELLHTWAKIIAGVPNSRLMLFPFGPNWSSQYPKSIFFDLLSSVFAEYGLSTERFLICDPQPTPNREGLKEYLKLADVYLDSYPFAGTTSLIEPLEVGLPAVARRGTCFRSAMGAAVVEALGLPELVGKDEDSYCQTAIALGMNASLRKEMSDRTRYAMQHLPSFLDGRHYSTQIATVLQDLLQKHQEQQLRQLLRLRRINLVAFPDWSQPEEELFADLVLLFRDIIEHPQSAEIALLIYASEMTDEEADAAISSVVMHLLLEEGLDISEEGPEILALGRLDPSQWVAVLPHLSARAMLAMEDQVAIAQVGAHSLPQWSVDSPVFAG